MKRWMIAPEDRYKPIAGLISALNANFAETEAATKSFVQSDQRNVAQFRAFSELLSIIHRSASCFWGCRGGSHKFEYLVGRAHNLLFGAHLLARGGLYDEALSLIRSVAEVSNLIALFTVDVAEFDKWHSLDELQSNDEFRPVVVRKKLEGRNVDPPYSRDHYRRLSGTSVHPTPAMVPQNHNERSYPFLGRYFRSRVSSCA